MYLHTVSSVTYWCRGSGNARLVSKSDGVCYTMVVLIPVGDHPIVVQFNDFSVGRHSVRVRFTTTGGQAEQDFNFDVSAEGNQCVP